MLHIFNEGDEWGGRSSQRDFCFKMAKRVANLAVLEKTSKHGYKGWEVVVIRERKADAHIGGRLAFRKGDEYLPTDREWGVYGWTVPEERVDEKLTEVGELLDRRLDK